MTTLPGLRPEQVAVVEAWFPGASLIADHSWDGAARAVLQLRHRDRDVVVKAGGPDDHHMDREIWAHTEVVRPLADRGLAPRLLHADRGLRLTATTYLPGVLVEGTAAEHEPGHVSAGRARPCPAPRADEPPGRRPRGAHGRQGTGVAD